MARLNRFLLLEIVLFCFVGCAKTQRVEESQTGALIEETIQEIQVDSIVSTQDPKENFTTQNQEEDFMTQNQDENHTIQNQEENITMETKKVNIGPKVALYPKPITVVGTYVEGKVNWLMVGHTGIIGHDRVLVSMSKSHYTNKGIKETGKLSINIVGHDMLKVAEYVGSVSGKETDKSQHFVYHVGEYGTPVIDASPVTMECEVVDNYETEGFDNFICKIHNTYVADVMVKDGKIDYKRLKPVLFDFASYSYLLTGEVIGQCLHLADAPTIVPKQTMGESGIVRIAKVEVYEQYVEEYMRYAVEVGEVSLREESGVLTMYAMQQKDAPYMITILETYASQEAYDMHIASPHFQRYKQSTAHMVKRLELLDQKPLNDANTIRNYIE